MEQISFISYQNKEDVPKNHLLSAAKLYCRIWEEEPWNEKWSIEVASDKLLGVLSKEGATLIFCLIKDEVVGFTGGKPIVAEELSGRVNEKLLNELNNVPLFLVAEIGVDSLQRGKGIGQKLLLKLIDTANADCDNLRFILHTDITAESAKILYRKLGFKDTHSVDLSITNHTYWIR
ncbi:MAG: GNAT family N-acetyltransferase [Candidatus Berkelbacteria bacterium]|nr:GNAT family N-acetyltransferase [Candidatus Berkelbacteria bacterium]